MFSCLVKSCWIFFLPIVNRLYLQPFYWGVSSHPNFFSNQVSAEDATSLWHTEGSVPNWASVGVLLIIHMYTLTITSPPSWLKLSFDIYANWLSLPTVDTSLTTAYLLSPWSPECISVCLRVLVTVKRHHISQQLLWRKHLLMGGGGTGL